jgi:hypothetical protein
MLDPVFLVAALLVSLAIFFHYLRLVCWWYITEVHNEPADLVDYD